MCMWLGWSTTCLDGFSLSFAGFGFECLCGVKRLRKRQLINTLGQNRFLESHSVNSEQDIPTADNLFPETFRFYLHNKIRSSNVKFHNSITTSCLIKGHLLHSKLHENWWISILESPVLFEILERTGVFGISQQLLLCICCSGMIATWAGMVDENAQNSCAH